MDNMTKITAISWAARRAGERYGTFQLALTPKERERIYREFAAHKRAERARLKALRLEEGANAADGGRAELPPMPSRRGGRAYSFNTAAAAQLYRQGRNDREIGEELGMSCGAIRNWRRRQGWEAVSRKCG